MIKDLLINEMWVGISGMATIIGLIVTSLIFYFTVRQQRNNKSQPTNEEAAKSKKRIMWMVILTASFLVTTLMGFFVSYKNTPYEQAPTFRLTFSANGGEYIRSQNFIYGVKGLIEGGTPRRDGFVFRGWSTDSTSTKPTHLNNNYVRLSGNDTLYAVWNSESTFPTYILTFNANGGKFSNGNKILTQNIKHGERKLLEGGTPIRKGCTFIGWHPKRNSTTATHLNNNYQTIGGNVTLYAVWNCKKVYIR